MKGYKEVIYKGYTIKLLKGVKWGYNIFNLAGGWEEEADGFKTCRAAQDAAEYAIDIWQQVEAETAVPDVEVSYADVKILCHHDYSSRLWEYHIIDTGEWIAESSGFESLAEAQQAAKDLVDFWAQDDGQEYVVLDDAAFEDALMQADEQEYRLLIDTRYPQPSAQEVKQAWQDTVASGVISTPTEDLETPDWVIRLRAKLKADYPKPRPAWMNHFEMLMENYGHKQLKEDWKAYKASLDSSLATPLQGEEELWDDMS